MDRWLLHWTFLVAHHAGFTMTRPCILIVDMSQRGNHSYGQTMEITSGLHGSLHKDIHCCMDHYTCNRDRSRRPTFLTTKQSLTGGFPSPPSLSRSFAGNSKGGLPFLQNDSCYQKRCAPKDYRHSWHFIGLRLTDQPTVRRSPNHKKSLQAGFSQIYLDLVQVSKSETCVVDPRGNQLECKALASDIAFPQFTVL